MWLNLISFPVNTVRPEATLYGGVGSSSCTPFTRLLRPFCSMSLLYILTLVHRKEACGELWDGADFFAVRFITLKLGCFEVLVLGIKLLLTRQRCYLGAELRCA